MLDVYSLVNVLPKLPLAIESLATSDDNIFIGTKEGHLLMYRVEFRGTFNKDGTEEAEVSLVKSSKNFSRRPISQLAVIKEFQIIVSLSDTVISVHDLSSTESGSFPVLDSISKTRGATLFAMSIIRDPLKMNEPKVAMCVVVRQRLLVLFHASYYIPFHASVSYKHYRKMFGVKVFHLKGWERKFEEATNVKISVPESPKCVVWANEALYINVAGEYQRMKLNGDFYKLFPIDRNQDPKIALLADGRLAFGLDEKCVFCNQEGNIMKEALIWSGMPNQFSQDAPFLIALFPNHVEIRPYYPPGKGTEAVQKVDIGRARIVCEAGDKGVVYIASATSVWALRKAQSNQLIDKLVSVKQFELAENIAKYSDANDVTKTEWLQSIRNLAAFHLFCEGHYDRAFDLFFQLGTEPPQVIGLFPDFLPSNVRSTMTYPSKCPELTGRALEHATSALIEYLKEWRQKLNLELSRSSSPAADDNAKALDQMQIVDTTLLKCYLATNPALASSLLRLSDNHCNFEESERSLRKARRFDELIILYKNKGHHKKALEFLRKELDNPESTLNGHQRMARYLTEIAKDELELVFQYVRFVIKASPEDALLVFTDELFDSDTIPRDKVFDFMSKTAPELFVPYLEHVINRWHDKNEVFHTALGEAYIKEASSLIKQDAEDPHLLQIRKKLQLFLAQSESYEPALLLTHLPLNCMFEERALVLGRMGRFEQALGLYVHVLREDDQAEKFCKQFYDTKSGDASQIYYLLFKTYVKPPEPSVLGVLLTDPPKTERKLEEALRILRKYSHCIDYAKAMELVPYTVPLNEISDFVATALQALTSRRRQVELMKNLHYAEYLQVQIRRINWEGESFTVNEEDTCDICRKRIGKTAFIRTADRRLRHYACGSRRKR